MEIQLYSGSSSAAGACCMSIIKVSLVLLSRRV